MFNLQLLQKSATTGSIGTCKDMHGKAGEVADSIFGTSDYKRKLLLGIPKWMRSKILHGEALQDEQNIVIRKASRVNGGTPHLAKSRLLAQQGARAFHTTCHHLVQALAQRSAKPCRAAFNM